MVGGQPRTGAARAWPLAVFVGVPIVLAVIWLLRTPPPPLDDCAAVIEGFGRVHDAWLSGVRLIFPLAALLVMSAILRVSAWRHEDGPTHGTMAVCATLAAYVVATAIVKGLYFVFGYVYSLAYVLLAFYWFVPVPLLIVGVVAYLLGKPPARPLTALTVTGWCSLLVVGGIAWYVAVGHDDPICLF